MGITRNKWKSCNTEKATTAEENTPISTLKRKGKLEQHGNWTKKKKGVPNTQETQETKTCLQNAPDINVRTTGCVVAKARTRPVVPITIHGFQTAALADTGARRTVLSYKMFKHIRTTGHSFRPAILQVTLAEGRPYVDELLLTTNEVYVSDKCLTIQFLIIPKAMLDIDFIKAAGLKFDFSRNNSGLAEDSRSVRLKRN